MQVVIRNKDSREQRAQKVQRLLASVNDGQKLVVRKESQRTVVSTSKS